VDKLFYSHVRAFLLGHQVGEDPEKNLAKIKLIANTNPARWDGKLPTRGIRPDTSRCAVTEATKAKPIAPWTWYAKEKEPVPEAVQDLYDRLTFDFSVVFHNGKAWIYVLVEPSEGTMAELSRQDHLKAFILMSLVNGNMPRDQREHQRVRLAAAMASKDVQSIFTFVAFKEDDPAYRSKPSGLPSLSRLVHPSSNTCTWNIRLPGQNLTYGSLEEIVPG
jgi:hypothetical protein